MRNFVCDVLSVIVGVAGIVVLMLFALAIQSTKSWETFLPNIGIMTLLIGLVTGIIILIQKIKK